MAMPSQHWDRTSVGAPCRQPTVRPSPPDGIVPAATTSLRRASSGHPVQCPGLSWTPGAPCLLVVGRACRRLTAPLRAGEALLTPQKGPHPGGPPKQAVIPGDGTTGRGMVLVTVSGTGPTGSEDTVGRHFPCNVSQEDGFVCSDRVIDRGISCVASIFLVMMMSRGLLVPERTSQGCDLSLQ